MLFVLLRCKVTYFFYNKKRHQPNVNLPTWHCQQRDRPRQRYFSLLMLKKCITTTQNLQNVKKKHYFCKSQHMRMIHLP